MKFLFSNSRILVDGKLKRSDILVFNDRIADISPIISPDRDTIVFDMNNLFIFPGLVDVHVHLREPGFSYKETIKSGTAAAARGGFTSVCAMPNLDPVPDSRTNLRPSLAAIEKDASVRVYPYGSITAGELSEKLSDMEELSPFVVAFSDDGRGVTDDKLMREAMIKAKSLGRMIVAHCEDLSLTRGGFVHDGEYARRHSYVGNPSESEWRQLERDIKLAEETGASYHMCHVSSKESVKLIREAKARGLDISCETAPHYLALCDEDIEDEGRFRMNPPIRSREDKESLIEGISDGTIDMIATDHAPHSAKEKSGGLRGSSNGIVGLETAFPVMYTELVKKNIITLSGLIELMQVKPSKRFGIGNRLAVGEAADFSVFDLEREYVIDPKEFLSMGESTPFEGKAVFGRCVMTMAAGKIVWREDQ